LARRGDPWAQYGIGLLHDPLEENGDAETAVIAERWYLKAANRALPQAQDKLARLYASGAGAVARDPDRAVLLWQTAARRGYAPAVDNLLAFKVAESQKIGPQRPTPAEKAAPSQTLDEMKAAGEAAGHFAADGTQAGRANSWYQLAAELGAVDARRPLSERKAPAGSTDVVERPDPGSLPQPSASTGEETQESDPPGARTPRAHAAKTPAREPPRGAPTTAPIYLMQLGSL
jgi:hypothetical protein